MARPVLELYESIPMKKLFLSVILLLSVASMKAEHSVARQWNEVLLEAIRNDFARPTVHARNLFHSSILMYDAWASVDPVAQPFFLGNAWGDYYCAFSGFYPAGDAEEEINKAISYASYRLIQYRFRLSPGFRETQENCDELMASLGYDVSNVSIDYASGDGATLGNYLASCMISFGLTDGSNDANDYANLFYEPVNTPMNPNFNGAYLEEPDRWQPLTFESFIGQAGFSAGEGPPDFLSPEWGIVTPFSLTEEDLTIHERDGHEYWVYHDPGPPPSIFDPSGDYQWGFSLVAWWSSHLDPSDSVMWDISPGAIGNLQSLPEDPADWRDFYAVEGGDPGEGHDLNPVTGLPYEPNIVPRGDYTRVLAEFWADGPDSETPPGHWFTILNYVSDHPELRKQYEGEGEELSDLEWDVKSYFLLGGAMHDAAIAAWGIKGYYDYVRPVSAIRYMAELGQSTNPIGSSYHPRGILLIPGLSEIIEAGDPLEYYRGQLENEIKLMAWAGPDKIGNPLIGVAGVEWITARSWWPYQRRSFVTPPFAGYVSGHSTFSRAAAEVLTMFTGDPFFPGGMGEFVADKNLFLVFEDGPSQDVVLQWATYRDASDQTSLSRIWGGIHPPADDIPGRLIGEKVGVTAFEKAKTYFEGNVQPTEVPVVTLFPNPVAGGQVLNVSVGASLEPGKIVMTDMTGREVFAEQFSAHPTQRFVPILTEDYARGWYTIQVVSGDEVSSGKVFIQ